MQGRESVVIERNRLSRSTEFRDNNKSKNRQGYQCAHTVFQKLGRYQRTSKQTLGQTRGTESLVVADLKIQQTIASQEERQTESS